MRRQFDEMDVVEALTALEEAVIKEAVQLTADPLPFGLGKWLNKAGADYGGSLKFDYLPCMLCNVKEKVRSRPC
jgi:hypothetical protein